MMAAGLRATAKALEHPPEPKVGAPVLDPTCGSRERVTAPGDPVGRRVNRRPYRDNRWCVQPMARETLSADCFLSWKEASGKP
jgi:hypothetical protein